MNSPTGLPLDADALRLVGDKVSLVRGGRLVVEAVSFEVAAGEALVVTGPNGAGKSSLLRAVAGLVSLHSGEIFLAGALRPASLHLVGHHNALKLQSSVMDNALFWAAFHGLDGGADHAQEQAEVALDAVGLAALYDMPAQYLSQGQRRRLALSRLVAAKRPVWLLDEPVAGLDTASRAVFSQLMAQHLGAGGLLMAATHDPLDLTAHRELRL